jgi:hypothetical protein
MQGENVMNTKTFGRVLFWAGIASILINILAIFLGSLQWVNVAAAFLGLIAVIFGWRLSHSEPRAN